MPNTTNFKFADVVLVPFPFTDQTTTKRRPAVVVSSRAYHTQRRDVIVMAITSQFRPANTVGEVAILHWQPAGLIKPSVLKPLLATLEKGVIIRALGALHEDDQGSLRRALDDIIG